MKDGDWVFVVNPAAGGGRGARAWARLQSGLAALPGTSRVFMTRGPGHAEELAAQAAREGAVAVISCGGDGTHREVAAGLLSVPEPRPCLGLLPIGTGSDLVKTLGIPTHPAKALAGLPRYVARPLDVGRFTCGTPAPGRDGLGGRPKVFLNVCSFGLSAQVVREVHRYKGLGGPAYLLATLRVLPGVRPVPVRIFVDDQPPLELETALVAVANARYFGGGMQVAPAARADDGLLDLVVFEGWGRMDFALRGWSMYRGAHVGLAGVRCLRGHKLRLECDEPIPLEVDGELAGGPPISFEVLPGALRVLAPVATGY